MHGSLVLVMVELWGAAALRLTHLLADPKALLFGTRLRTILLKNLPPATFSLRKMPS